MYTQQEIEEAGLDDFRHFLRQVWDFLGLPEPTPVQNDIARWLQEGPDRAILSAFRGVGKSWITAAFVLWLLFLDPQRKIMVVSASQQLADDFSKFTKQLIREMPLLQHLAPRGDQRDSGLSFDVGPAVASKDPSVKSAGITGQITGSRADIIIADDIEIPKNSYTHLLRERLSDLVKEFDAVLKPGGRVLYLGTPQVEDSLYNKLIPRGYSMRVWPAEVPSKPGNYGGRLAPFVQRMIERGEPVGSSVEPRRFPEEELAGRKASYGMAGYALQFMLDVNPSEIDKHPLKLSDLIVTDTDGEQGRVKLVWGRERELTIQDLPAGGYDGDCYHRPAWKSEEMSKWQGTVLAIDPSGRGRDETAYAIIRFLHGMLYLVEVGGFLDGFSESTLETIAKRAAHHRVNSWIAEENYGGGMFTQLLKPLMLKHGGGRFDEDWDGWSRGQKELRILDTLEPLTSSHRLVVDRKVIEEDLKKQHESPFYSFVYQFTRMERIKGALPHDDRVEAVAMAASYWTERMDRDRDKAVLMERGKALDLELKKFKNHVFGVKPQGRGRYSKWA